MNVYKHTASQKSSVGNSSKVRQPVLSSSGASSNSLLSLGKNGAGQSNKSSNSILISELAKFGLFEVGQSDLGGRLTNTQSGMAALPTNRVCV